MTHDSTWLDRTRAARRTRVAAPLAFVLACALLAVFASTSSASTPEMRGEWSLVMHSGGNSLDGTSIIDKETNVKEEFESASTTFAGGLFSGVFSGTLEGSKATVKITLAGGGVTGEFASSEITVSNGATPQLSGPGTFTVNGSPSSGTLVATRIKTYQEIVEKEEREKREREESEARVNVRGEWSLTLEAGPEKLKGIALIATSANAKNEFASKSALFEGILGGSFSGTLEGENAKVTVTTEGNQTLSIPPGSFTSETIAVSSKTDPTSMTGTGKFTVGGTEVTGTLTATRIRTYQQIEEQEAKEKAEQEAKLKAEQEAKEKAEQEAKVKAEQEAKAKAEQEAKLKAEQEAKAKAEREAREKQEKEGAIALALVSAEPTAKTLTAGSSGSLALGLTNHNAYAVEGHLTLTAHKAKKTTLSFGDASFTISAKGSETVKIKLSSAARAYLTHHKTLSVSLAVSTSASSGMHSVKTYTITLHAFGSGHHKG
jgi:hypothetical protein